MHWVTPHAIPKDLGVEVLGVVLQSALHLHLALVELHLGLLCCQLGLDALRVHRVQCLGQLLDSDSRGGVREGGGWREVWFSLVLHGSELSAHNLHLTLMLLMQLGGTAACSLHVLHLALQHRLSVGLSVPQGEVVGVGVRV